MERCSMLEMLLGALTSASSQFCLLKTRGHVKDRGNDWAAAGQHFYLVIRILINTLLREYRKIIIPSAVFFQTAWSHDLKKASLIPLAVLFPVLPGILCHEGTLLTHTHLVHQESPHPFLPSCFPGSLPPGCTGACGYSYPRARLCTALCWTSGGSYLPFLQLDSMPLIKTLWAWQFC